MREPECQRTSQPGIFWRASLAGEEDAIRPSCGPVDGDNFLETLELRAVFRRLCYSREFTSRSAPPMSIRFVPPVFHTCGKHCGKSASGACDRCERACLRRLRCDDACQGPKNRPWRVA